MAGIVSDEHPDSVEIGRHGLGDSTRWLWLERLSLKRLSLKMALAEMALAQMALARWLRPLLSKAGLRAVLLKSGESTSCHRQKD